jgi:hypothetical protein
MDKQENNRISRYRGISNNNNLINRCGGLVTITSLADVDQGK